MTINGSIFPINDESCRKPKGKNCAQNNNYGRCSSLEIIIRVCKLEPRSRMGPVFSGKFFKAEIVSKPHARKGRKKLREKASLASFIWDFGREDEMDSVEVILFL